MDAWLLLRTLGALSAVLALLAGALWAVRRYDLALPGRIGARKAARLSLMERVTLDPKRSVALVRHGATEHLLLLAPEGNMLLSGADEAENAAPLLIDLAACRAQQEDRPFMLDLAHCRALAGAPFADVVPIPPAPAPGPASWPVMPPSPLPRSPQRPRHTPRPVRVA